MHYCVLVITNEDPFDLLAIYDEELDGPLRKVQTHEELLEHMAKLKECNPNIKQLQGDPMEAAEYWYQQFSKEFVKDGEVWSFSNPRAKWDWYMPGGRFIDALDDHYDWDYYDEDGYGYNDNEWFEVDKIKEDFCPAAVVTPDGEWHEPGEYGWFSLNASDEEYKEYQKTVYEKYIKPYSDYKAWLIDCHI